MSDSKNEELFERLLNSSWKVLAFLRNKLPELIFRRSPYLVTSAFGNSSNHIADREHHPLGRMAARDAIDISSSDDSDLREIDEYRDESPLRDSATSAITSPNPNPRVLPSWASQSSSNASGVNLPSQKAPSPKRSLYSDRNVNSHVHPRPQMRSFSRDNGGASTSRTAYDENYKFSVGNDYEKLSSQQVPKRMLPPSFHPSMPSGRSNNLVQSVSGSMIHETNAKSYPSGWSNSANGKNHLRDHATGGNNSGPFMYENKGNRVLPPSLVHGKYASATPFVGPNDPLRPSAVGEERAGGTDERIVYQAALQDLNQPKVEATLPDGLLSVSLLRHQKIALAWMLQKETTGNPCSGGILADDQGLGKTISMIALIQMQRSLQEKSKPKHPCNTSAEALNLDDEDDESGGAPDKAKLVELSDDLKVVQEPSPSVQEFRSKRPAAGTLVVCPASILQQWAQEIDEKVAEEAKLSVVVYHGSNRTKDPIELANYDVVLTTYTIVTKEVPKQPLVEEDDEEQNSGDKYGLSSEFLINKKRKKAAVNKRGKKGRKGIDISAFESDCGTLAKVRWARVILDEAQTIKNHRTQVARACCSLRAKTRWCLSGTPIQNAIDELFSYFRFLRYDPYAEYKSFCNAIKLSISRNSVTGYKKLQAILRATMLRRTKGTLIDGEPIISLPPKTTHLKRVDFSPEEWAFYKRLEADSRSQFKKYAEAGTLNQNYANILLMLLRLRQACDHPLLVKGFSSGSVGKVSTGRAKGLPRETVIKLLKLLETSSAICSACDDPPEDAVVTTCRHVFCYQCVSDYLTGEDNTCPAPGCKEQLGAENVFTKATLRRCVVDDDDSDPSSSEFEEKSDLQNKCGSSKIEAVLEILKSHHKTKSDLVPCNGDASSSGKGYQESQVEGPIKTIIFSQWTTMLDLLEISLKSNGIMFRRLDGTMSLPARDKAVKIFKTNPEVTVMLMSLKAGNLGLNMVAACHVILLDLWWNPTTEDQAVDRAHRIGQTRPVTVSRLTIKDTVEDRILALQEEKRKMVAAAFGEDHTGGSATRLTVEDLRYLFNM